ncbi:MAG: hypothetical protein ACOX4H_01965 [Bacillota bacterium]|nr:hypothetical protein [Clostridia bacterium]
MNNLIQGMEKYIQNIQNKINEIQKLAHDFQDSVLEAQKFAADFQETIIEMQLLVQKYIKIALAVLVAVIIIFFIRDCFNWWMLVRIKKQNLELLQKMTRIIALLEEDIKKKDNKK